MTSASRTEPPGWMTAVAPASATTSRPSGKGKKASEAATDAGERKGGLHGAEAGGVDAAHLAGADADGLAEAGVGAGVDDGVGLDVLADAPGEEEGCGVRRRWADAR